MVETSFKQTRFRAQILKIEYHCPTCCASFQNPQPSLAENKLLFQLHTTSYRSSLRWKLQNSYGGACPESSLSLRQTSLIFIILGRAGGGEGKVCAHIGSGYKSFLGRAKLRLMPCFLFQNKCIGPTQESQ